MLRRADVQGLRAMLELAQDPLRWRSVSDIASSQELPAAMLEQLLLKLRRAGLVEARRGRTGGYRLRGRPATVSLSMVLDALAPVQPSPDPEAGQAIAPSGPQPTPRIAARQVAAALELRLQRALERELNQISLADLLFDLRSSQASLEDDGGLMLP